MRIDFKNTSNGNSILLLLLLCFSINVNAQFRNNTWLIGNQGLFSVPKTRMVFSDTSYTLNTEYRKMPFEGTNASISDENGNFLMSSNGVWIANAVGDTMENGSDLNPNSYTGSYPRGLLIPYANIILPFPGDTNKYALFHHTAIFDGFSYPALDIFYSLIDITKDNGLGALDSINKNISVLHDSLGWGVAACRHANGRDWWIVALRNKSDIIYKILLTPQGVTNVTQQSLNVPYIYYGNSQPTFSPDGKKFAYVYGDGGTIDNYDIRLFDFDRCTGVFSNEHWIDLSDGSAGFGCAFSPNAEFVYATTIGHVFQIDVNTLFVDTIATYDGFCFPNNPWCTTFWNMYLAANGKIYITSGSGVQHIHEMNYPDSAGTACDLQQHAISLNGVWSFRAVPNHPNYNLGCDTTGGCTCLTALEDLNNYDFRFSISPNPVSNRQLKIVYVLPQNQKGIFEIFDVNGRKVFTMPLPQWSTLQNVLLPELGNGIYNCVITSGNLRVSKKVVVMK